MDGSQSPPPHPWDDWFQNNVWVDKGEAETTHHSVYFVDCCLSVLELGTVAQSNHISPLSSVLENIFF